MGAPVGSVSFSGRARAPGAIASAVLVFPREASVPLPPPLAPLASKLAPKSTPLLGVYPRSGLKTTVVDCTTRTCDADRPRTPQRHARRHYRARGTRISTRRPRTATGPPPNHQVYAESGVHLEYRRRLLAHEDLHRTPPYSYGAALQRRFTQGLARDAYLPRGRHAAPPHRVVVSIPPPSP